MTHGGNDSSHVIIMITTRHFTCQIWLGLGISNKIVKSWISCFSVVWVITNANIKKVAKKWNSQEESDAKKPKT